MQSLVAWRMMLERASHVLFLPEDKAAAQRCISICKRLICLDAIIQCAPPYPCGLLKGSIAHPIP